MSERGVVSAAKTSAENLLKAAVKDLLMAEVSLSKGFGESLRKMAEEHLKILPDLFKKALAEGDFTAAFLCLLAGELCLVETYLTMLGDVIDHILITLKDIQSALETLSGGQASPKSR